MKKKVFGLLLFAAIAIFMSSCDKECTCSKWSDGKNVDTDPVVYSQDEINKLNVKNCADLNDYYVALGIGYDEATGNGIKCQ